MTVGDGAVAARLAQVEASLGGAAALQATLSAAGLSLSDYRQELRDALLAEALGARKFPAATPSNAQVLAFYRAHRDELTTPPAVRLAEILVKTQSLGRAVIDRLRLGYSFAEVARAYSMDPDSVAPGGVLGWVTTSSLPAPLARALAKAPRGTIVGPVQAIGGWHVLKVLGRRAAYTQPVAAARPAIVAQLTTAAPGRAPVGLACPGAGCGPRDDRVLAARVRAAAARRAGLAARRRAPAARRPRGRAILLLRHLHPGAAP